MSRVRKSSLARRRSLSTAERDDASARICDRIIHSHEFMSAHNIGCYLPARDEVQTTPIIDRAWRAGKRIFVPVTDTHGSMNFCEITNDTVIARNQYGIWEPISGALISTKELDIVITPVVAFDKHNHRIGMGSGYFDRCFHFLKNRRKWLKPKLIGVAFECQRTTKILPNTWDVPLYRVVTNAK